MTTQQHTMQHMLHEEWGKTVIVYIDNGPIFDEEPGMSLFHYYQTCWRRVTILRANKFYLSRKKTVFFVDMENEGMDLLGRHIQKGGISIAKNKVDGFVALPSPTNFAELNKTIGMFTWLTDHFPWAAD